MFCTENVLVLAREKRRTNFIFHPADAIREQCLGWKGIDYLGKKWPPKKWYPDAPSAGRTLEEWLELLGSGDEGGSWSVRRALMDLGESTVPGLVRLLKTGNRAARRRAADLLSFFARYKGAKLSTGTWSLIEAQDRAAIDEILAYGVDDMVPSLINHMKGTPLGQQTLAAEKLVEMMGKPHRYADMIRSHRQTIEENIRKKDSRWGGRG